MADVRRVKGLQRDYEVYGALCLLRQWGAWCQSGGKYVQDYRSPAGQVVVDNVEQPRVGWAISDEVAEMMGRIVDDIGTRDGLGGDALRLRFLQDLPFHRIASSLGIKQRETVPFIVEGAIGRVDEVIRSLVYPRQDIV